MSISIYNSRTRSKEVFESLEPGHVKMYVCGPTVYDFLHVGNFRGAIFFNLVRNWLERRGYRVDFVYNYTDVDDRILERARREGVEAGEVSARYIAEFERDFRALGLKAHSHNPRVTGFIPEIVALIASLVEKGKAYRAGGDVYFDVHAQPGYGALSRKNVDDLEAGARIEVDPRKRNAADFALWKAAKPGEPAWSSPWGEGRPGWHIECSAMAKALLGITIDIHGGGLDLLFPHHENEVAQSEGASGKPFVRYWMHNNMLNFGSQKMSKSLGNVRTGRSFMEEWHPEILKYLMLSAHYRSVLDFAPAQIDQAVVNLARIYSALALARALDPGGGALDVGGGAAPAPAAFHTSLSEARSGVDQSFDDDFNTPGALARVFEAVRAFNALARAPGPATPAKRAAAAAFAGFARDVGSVMGLFHEPAAGFLTVLDDLLLKQKGLLRADVDRLVAERVEARTARDFARADRLRGELAAMGIELRDTAAGSEWEVAK